MTRRTSRAITAAALVRPPAIASHRAGSVDHPHRFRRMSRDVQLVSGAGCVETVS